MVLRLMKTIDVLGTPLAATTYDDLTTECRERASQPGVSTIDFTNTHVITLRRHDSGFHDLTSHFDLFVPDGMPLIWCMNRRGASLDDRVYGPTFMRRFLAGAPGTGRHFLVGGSEECGRRLRARFPRVNFVGGFHGNCSAEGILEGRADLAVINEINRLSPDFIWVGLGAPKQYRWIERNRSRLERGVVFSVGFAFDVNAGTKLDAPVWMQGAGLTWVFRAFSEPRRLLTRYLRYNSLFLFYLLKGSRNSRSVVR